MERNERLRLEAMRRQPKRTLDLVDEVLKTAHPPQRLSDAQLDRVAQLAVSVSLSEGESLFEQQDMAQQVAQLCEPPVDGGVKRLERPVVEPRASHDYGAT